jgi:predicted house-cleaning noncanonical NTP pyrophosphatase (MazG superfamily)
MMKRIFFNKLVRDHIPYEEGWHFETKNLRYGKFLYFLKRKLVEESRELSYASSKQEIIEELSDVFDVFNQILVEYNVPMSQILEQSAKKKEKRGSFSKRLFLEYIDIPENDPKYQLFSEKYKNNKTVMIDDSKSNSEIINETQNNQ